MGIGYHVDVDFEIVTVSTSEEAAAGYETRSRGNGS